MNYAFMIRCMYERCLNVASKHCRANLVSGRIPVKRQILSVHVYDKILTRLVYVKQVRYEPQTISLCVARQVPNYEILR
jgi:hypothetical protein